MDLAVVVDQEQRLDQPHLLAVMELQVKGLTVEVVGIKMV